MKAAKVVGKRSPGAKKPLRGELPQERWKPKTNDHEKTSGTSEKKNG